MLCTFYAGTVRVLLCCKLTKVYIVLSYTTEVKCMYANCMITFFFASATLMGQLPLLEVNGVTICQSMAINRFLAKQFGE